MSGGVGARLAPRRGPWVTVLGPPSAAALLLLASESLTLTAEGGGWQSAAPADTCLACRPTDPTVEVVSAMRDLAVQEGGPAELLCQYSRPVQATWKMDEQEVCADGHRVVIEQDWTVARLSFRPALPCDSGIYSCEAAGTRVVALLQVQGEAAWRAAPGPGQPRPAGRVAGSDRMRERGAPRKQIAGPEPTHPDPFLSPGSRTEQLENKGRGYSKDLPPKRPVGEGWGPRPAGR